MRKLTIEELEEARLRILVDDLIRYMKDATPAIRAYLLNKILESLTISELVMMKDESAKLERFSEFMPGDRIDFCGEIFTVLENHGSSGKVRMQDGTICEKFYWSFGDEEAVLVDEEGGGDLDPLPSVEPWLQNNPIARASVERGLEQAAASRGRCIGSFAEYADIEIED